MSRSTFQKIERYLQLRSLTPEQLGALVDLQSCRWNELTLNPNNITETEIGYIDLALDVPEDERGLVFGNYGEKFDYFTHQRHVSHRSVARAVGLKKSTPNDWVRKGYKPKDPDTVARVDIFLDIPQKYHGIPGQHIHESKQQVSAQHETPGGLRGVTLEDQIRTTFYSLASYIEKYREASPDAIARLKQKLPGGDVGYVTSFLRALYGSQDELDRFMALNERRKHIGGDKKC